MLECLKLTKKEFSQQLLKEDFHPNNTAHVASKRNRFGFMLSLTDTSKLPPLLFKSIELKLARLKDS